MARWAARAGRFRRSLLDRVGGGMMLPFIGLVVMALASGISVIALLVARMDDSSAGYMRDVVSGALRQEVRAIGDQAFSTARWDDAVAHLYGRVDRDWAATNLSYPMHSYVIDGQGRTLWSARGGGGAVPALGKASPAALHVLLRRLPRDEAAARRLKTGVALIASFQGRPAVIGAMAVLPLQGTRQLHGQPLRYIAFVRMIDGAMLDKWKESFRMPAIGWHPASEGHTHDELNVVAVTAAEGARLGHIVWPAEHAGRTALAGIEPLLASCAIVFAALSMWLVHLIHRSRSALEANSAMARNAAAEATRNAEQAEQARREVEAALAEAEQARRRAAELARRESAEQAAYQRQLRENSRRIAAALQESMSSLVKQLLETAADLELSAESTLRIIQEQQQQADIVRTRSREATGAVQAIAGGIGELTASIAEIRRAAEEARLSAQTASGQSAAARGANDHLLDQVGSIGNAASLISSIAKQTNLLALNASIEAARAGESGYGFVVVANEVKALAAQTAQTTRDIHDRIEGIEAAVRSTVALVGGVDEILGGLVESMAGSSATVQQQQVVAQDIQRNSRGVAESAQTADQAVEAISSSLENVARTAASTRQIGAAVRHRAEHLGAEFARLVAQLEAA